MPYYVYIIQNKIDGSFYKGYSENPLRRLEQHNNGDTTSTSKNKGSWILVYIEMFNSKSEALRREKNLKKATRERLIAVINHPRNILSQFIKNANG